MLDINRCCLAIVDVQGKLAQSMDDKETLFQNIRILIQAAKLLNIPILWCQQVPEALGPTVPEIAELLADNVPIDKASFSCCDAAPFQAQLETMGRSQVVLCGIETHVCIYQTALDLLDQDFEVCVVADAVSSRTTENKRIALTRIAEEGADLASTEMALFELLRTAEHPKFRAVAKLVR